MQQKLVQNLTPYTNSHESLFLSFEGIEGSGKSSQIQKLEEYLLEQGLKVHKFREPGGTKFGEKLREAILQSDVSLDPMAEACLFASARAQLLTEKIFPLLEEKGNIVICDRFIHSSLAYQGVARKMGLEKVLALHQDYPLNTIPHKTYYLAIDLETSHQRQKTRGNEKDYFESEKAQFYQDLIKGYEEMKSLFPDTFVRVDGNQNFDKLNEFLRQDILGLLKK